MGFIEDVAPYAQKYSKNIFPSVTIAQAVLESGWGKSRPAQDYNNYFGIKGDGVVLPTLEDDGSGNYYQIKDSFRVYDDWGGAFKDHDAIFETSPKLMHIPKAKTPEDQCRAMVGSYATDTAYADKLIRIINANNLKQYDQGYDKGSDDVGINLQAAVDYMYSLANQGINYSMYGSRTGSDGTGDCSGTVYTALRQAGCSDAGWILNTDSMHDWLERNGFELIAHNQAWDAVMGDVCIFGTKGASGGAAGHVVLFVDAWNVIHCNYARNGVTVDNEAVVCPYSMGWYVYRLKDFKPEAPAKFEPGNKVDLQEYATHFQIGEKIADHVKGKTFTVKEVKAVNAANSDWAYLLADDTSYLGWILEQDLAKHIEKTDKFQIGDKVKLRGDKATHWAGIYTDLVRNGGQPVSERDIDKGLQDKAFQVTWLGDERTVELALLKEDGTQGQYRYIAYDWDLVDY
ncbi:peptidoglycan amidohydrolase family protein [Aerococcus urinae]|uniref:peptidoglycan amidohydrolase family protein n=1 Tax=Aerococcus urinae TaxID=1376 RepID=UPI00255070D5|nr:peptidoglycan amidohydrolase family protein [Aerococcus urinae]MDK7302446.1 peptidoglycan amidohydrolase family protein [Aerococcus urinae]